MFNTALELCKTLALMLPVLDHSSSFLKTSITMCWVRQGKTAYSFLCTLSVSITSWQVKLQLYVKVYPAHCCVVV